MIKKIYSTALSLTVVIKNVDAMSPESAQRAPWEVHPEKAGGDKSAGNSRHVAKKRHKQPWAKFADEITNYFSMAYHMGDVARLTRDKVLGKQLKDGNCRDPKKLLKWLKHQLHFYETVHAKAADPKNTEDIQTIKDRYLKPVTKEDIERKLESAQKYVLEPTCDLLDWKNGYDKELLKNITVYLRCASQGVIQNGLYSTIKKAMDLNQCQQPKMLKKWVKDKGHELKQKYYDLKKNGGDTRSFTDELTEESVGKELIAAQIDYIGKFQEEINIFWNKYRESTGFAEDKYHKTEQSKQLKKQLLKHAKDSCSASEYIQVRNDFRDSHESEKKRVRHAARQKDKTLQTLAEEDEKQPEHLSDGTTLSEQGNASNSLSHHDCDINGDTNSNSSNGAPKPAKVPSQRNDTGSDSENKPVL